MVVSAEKYQEVLAAAEAMPPPGVSEYDKLQSLEALIAFAYREFAAEDPETALDWTEMLVRSIDIDAPRVRRIERTLRQLGFTELSARLREIGGRRTHDLVPLK